MELNNKTNIYKASQGFSFLGYTYRVVNDKLRISCYKKTYLRIQKKLLFLKDKYPMQYRKSLASYYGYFQNNLLKERESFKMKLIEKSQLLKKQYPNHIIIMQEGIFYKTFYEDALIIWYLFDYKCVKDTVSFGATPYDKVLAKLNRLDISYVVISQDKEVIKVTKDAENYISFQKLSIKSYEKQENTRKLIEKLKEVLEVKLESYNQINTILDNILESK